VDPATPHAEDTGKPNVPEQRPQALRAETGKEGQDDLAQWIPDGFSRPVERTVAQGDRGDWLTPQVPPEEPAPPDFTLAFEPPPPESPNGEAAQRAASEEKRAEAAESRAEAAESRAEAAEGRAEAAERRASEAEERVGEMEREVATIRQRAEGMKRAAARSAASRYPDSEPPPRANEGLGLNEITFEALRELGLSINQAARFVGQRDQLHGLREVDDVDKLLGLPRDVKEKLKQVGSV